MRNEKRGIFNHDEEPYPEIMKKKMPTNYTNYTKKKKKN